MTDRPILGRRLRGVSLVSLVALVLILITGCSTDAEPDASAEIERTVRRYNELLSWGYANLDMNRLTEVATVGQAQTEYYHMAAIGEGGMKLEAILDSIEFDEVSIEGTSAVAVTRETWSYIQIAIDSGLPAARNRVSYGLRYDLSLQGERWLVSEVSAFETADVPLEESTLPTNAVPFDRPSNVPRGSLVQP